MIKFTKETSYYSAPALAKLLEVNVSTIKRWVDKGILKAEITSGGHRRVSADDLAVFVAKQKKLKKNSYIIGRLAKQSVLSPQHSWEGYYYFLFSNTSLSSRNILEEYFLRGVKLVEIIEQIILPVLAKVGQAWEQGRLSIYEEHRMVFLLRSDLIRLDRMIPAVTSAKSPAVVLACVKDENHEIPLFLLHLLLKQAGFKTIILGINTPAQDTALAVAKNKAKILCLTKSFSKMNEETYLQTVKKHLGENKVLVALGGAGWSGKNYQGQNFKKFSNFKGFLEQAVKYKK